MNTETMTSTTIAIEPKVESVPVVKPVPNYRKVLENYGSFEMFTERGNRACHTGMKKIFKKVEGKRKLNQEKIQEFVKKVMDAIETKHSEVYDTEPAYHFRHLTNMALKENGYSFEVER